MEKQSDAEKRNAVIEDLTVFGTLMANFLFNLKQHQGRTLTSGDCEAAARLQGKWDAAIRSLKSPDPSNGKKV
jgi:hypothetical protein